MENEIIVGLDIGTTKIACFVGMRGESGKVKILGFGKTDSKGVEHGVVKNVSETAESIRRAVGEAADQADVDIDEVWVGIAGQHIKSRPSQGSAAWRLLSPSRPPPPCPPGRRQQTCPRRARA